MKRILFSLMTMVAVLSVAGVGSLAYVVDNETSSANVFSAGKCGRCTIDIKPEDPTNSINLASEGVIPVAILTTTDFDASTVDAETVRFGPAGARAIHWAFEDVDEDHDLDMILHFRTQDTGITADDTEAELTGRTVDGWPIGGSDSVRIVPPG